jgi:hypothetical protein
MNKFTVSVDDFYRAFAFDSPRIGDCMRELIERYGIASRKRALSGDAGPKSVLAIAAGAAVEERYFAEAGCRLVMIDIDERGGMLPVLQKMPSSHGITYWIADAVSDIGDIGVYDVVYMSSFTPDEMRREALVQANAARGRSWRTNDDPFHPAIMRYADAVAPDGLLIVQSYCGGIDTDANPNYLNACRRQLLRNGLQLLEVHRFEKTPGIMLYTAVKGHPRAAPADKLSQFHGRAEPDHTKRIFAATGRERSPGFVGRLLDRMAALTP